MADTIEDRLIADVSRRVVAQAAPEELALFRPISAEYFKDPDRALKAESGGDEALGFGVADGAILLTPYVLAVTKEVVAFLYEQVKKSAREQSAPLIADWVARLFGQGRPASEHAEVGGPPSLSREQLARVRELAREKALALDLPADKAELLADSMVGSLAAAPA